MVFVSQFDRYYSNAFTDMVKQDAMNVFLGFYIPNEMLVPLWDLDSDYYLHNRISRPSTPYINRILYQENQLSMVSNLSSRKASFCIETATNLDYSLSSKYGDRSCVDREETEMSAQNAGKQRKQEILLKKYFINDRAIVSSISEPLRHAKSGGLVTASGKGPPLKTDVPLLLQDCDHDFSICQLPLAHTPKRGICFLYNITNHVSL